MAGTDLERADITAMAQGILPQQRTATELGIKKHPLAVFRQLDESAVRLLPAPIGQLLQSCVGRFRLVGITVDENAILSPYQVFVSSGCSRIQSTEPSGFRTGNAS